MFKKKNTYKCWTYLFELNLNLKIMNAKVNCKKHSVQSCFYSLGLFDFHVNWYCEFLVLLKVSITDCFKFILCIGRETPIHGINKEEFMCYNLLNIYTCSVFLTPCILEDALQYALHETCWFLNTDHLLKKVPVTKFNDGRSFQVEGDIENCCSVSMPHISLYDQFDDTLRL